MAGMEICEKVANVAAPEEMTELVRGHELGLMEKMEPLVERESVSLDLSGVERIDAAGIAALIRLYCDAHKAGHEFKIVHPGRHVREILGLVGLERLFVESEPTDPSLETAA
jgi:anti-sigma B factor antagonist